MSNRYLGGYLTASYNPLLVPNAPTIGSATAGDGNATVAFTAPSNVGGGPITSYVAVSSPGGFTGTGTTSPITVTGLTNGTSYTFTVYAVNAYGPSDLSASSNSITPAPPATDGLFGGTTASATINKINFASLGNSTNFGNLSVACHSMAGIGSSTQGIWAGGDGFGAGVINVIQYVTFATTGNSTDWGDLVTPKYIVAGCGNSTRGLISYGRNASARTAAIDYISLASTGNAAYFGDGIAYQQVGALSNSTRGLIFGGETTSSTNIINYVTIATTGNTTDFGDLLVADYAAAGCASSTRGLMGGGAASNTIQYVTIATTGNAVDFGDLQSQYLYGPSAMSSNTIGVWAQGSNQISQSNVLQYVTIASTGNSTDFGDALANGYQAAGCSNCHGGLQ